MPLGGVPALSWCGVVSLGGKHIIIGGELIAPPSCIFSFSAEAHSAFLLNRCEAAEERKRILYIDVHDMSVYIYKYIKYIYVYTYVCVYAYICIYTYMYMYVYIYIYIININTHTHTHTHIVLVREGVSRG